ncbi:hypothetical protein [Anaerobaca lacustris]|uniref:SnoaL-like domain-containing protein n=1 Tax=Anaerobaca lacustris TaxID=3044600 RepID=A0AAW6TW40_9BACT|nr:hypothetical protein [Sedimentisphaerales bacterium M17dextr]
MGDSRAISRRNGIVVVALAVAGVAWAIAGLYRADRSPAPSQTESAPQADEPIAPLGAAPLIGALRDGDDARSPAPPPLIFMVGRPDADGAPDLSTPAQAVHSVLALLDRGRMEALPQCFSDAAPDASEGLYPRRLGPPVELVDMVEDGDAATVVWSAAVHTGFTLDGRSRSPGETVTLTTRLVRIEGLWKLVELHDGGEEHEASAK